jgi:hypothetical protein
MMLCKSEHSAFQPSTVLARALDAVSLAGSPARRGAIFAGIGLPVIFRAVSSTSSTELPVSLPKFNTMLSPDAAM